MSNVYDSNPDIIGELCQLLDKKQRGVKNWKELANLLEVSRKEFKHFESSLQGNPSKQLIEYICSRQPHFTVGDFKDHLTKIKRKDALSVLNSSKKG